MAKSENQKSKLLHLAQILLTETDENHGLTTNQLIEKLAALDIKAERKSIYNDIAALQDFGLDIIPSKGKHTTYFIGSRDFELGELKLLADAVSASRFIPQNKSLNLISKLEKLTSRHEAVKLRRQVTLTGRAKTQSSSVLHAIDALHSAISSGRQVTFHYTRRTPSKEVVYRNDNKLYQVSPWQLCWDDENYYLLAYNSEHQEIRHYRVDRMAKVTVLEDTPREGSEVFENFDLGQYSTQTFGMFSGEVTKVVLNCKDSLADVILDRFGDGVFLVPGNDGTFNAHVNVIVSPVFLGWLAGYGKDIKVIEPASVRDELLSLIKEIVENYK